MLLKTLVTETHDPYFNLALEEYLLDSLQPSECILYLWQNANTVVIGRNQNAYKECRVEKLLADGGILARRSSGGGSVYHDLGNLNFTFLAQEQDYNVQRQLSVITQALEQYGVQAYATGRNDISVDQRKVSGNAFFTRGQRCCHHGTILVNVDVAKMEEYLAPAADKLRGNSAESVRSRVANLTEYKPDMDIIGLRTALLHTFETVYESKAQSIRLASFDSQLLAALKEKYASPEWVYGRNIQADYSCNYRFPWGGIEFTFTIRGESIADVQVFSDALDADSIETMARRLMGVPFRRGAVLDALNAGAGAAADPQLLADVSAWMGKLEIWS